MNRANDTYGIHFETARMLRILTVFKPIIMIDDNIIYDPTSNDNIPTDPDVSRNQGKGGKLIPDVRQRHREIKLIPDALLLHRSDPTDLDSGTLISIRESKEAETHPSHYQRMSSKTSPQVRSEFFDFLDKLDNMEKGHWKDFKSP